MTKSNISHIHLTPAARVHFTYEYMDGNWRHVTLPLCSLILDWRFENQFTPENGAYIHDVVLYPVDRFPIPVDDYADDPLTFEEFMQAIEEGVSNP